MGTLLGTVKDVYHYTDMNGFISIMQNKELWLTHIRFMNDRKEYLEGRELCKDVFSLSLSHSRDSLDMWRGYGQSSGIAIGYFIFPQSLSYSLTMVSFSFL